MSWADSADRVLCTLFVRGQPAPTRAEMRDAYPFGERRYHPYKMWGKRVKAWRHAHTLGYSHPSRLSPMEARRGKLARYDRETGELFTEAV